MKNDVVIIGGGIGGLFAGAFLAKNGLTVTILEKNSIIGGGLQCFHRKGKIYETGMHVMGGFEKGGSLTKICNYLGILDILNIQHVPCGCMDEIMYDIPKTQYNIPSGREAFVNYFSELFPEDANGIKEYVDEIYRLTEEVPLFYLKEAQHSLTVHSEKFTWAANRLINHYVKNPKLQEVLAYLNPLYGGIENHTPAYVHALINVLYIGGASRFVGGSQQLADALKSVIEAHEGKVLAGKEVSDISVTDKNINYVKTSGGDLYEGTWYISAIHPTELIRLVPQGTFLRGFVNRLNEIPNSYSAFSLFIDLKPDKIPYINHICYYMSDYGYMWNQHKVSEDVWPKGFMYMTPPDPDQGKYASRLLVHCIMDYSEVDKWAKTGVGKRGADYYNWKEERVEQILSKLEIPLPGLREAIDNVYAASPLTIRDYFHTKNGAIFGYRKDCENLIFSQLPVYTKVKNLLLTGQNINLHGICGVPLTAINTAEAILGVNTLVKKINDTYKDY